MNASSRIAVVAGATGLVGRELCGILAAGGFTVRALARRPVPGTETHPADYEHLDPALFGGVECAFSGLGTTIKVAGSQAAFRRVDYDFNLAFARAAHSAGVTRFGLVSAAGANPRSLLFYSRVKGELEAALTELDFARLVIARPSFLVGNRSRLGQPARPGETWAERVLSPLAPVLPADLRPIAAATVARALVSAVTGGAGATILSSRDLSRLGA